MEGTNGSNSDTYVLPTGSIGAARLLMQDELYGASTRTMMLDRGLRPGMRVLDLPCGTGTVSGWIAQQVGDQGSVVGADIDRDQLGVAQSQCRGVPQLEFMEANVYATGFPTGTSTWSIAGCCCVTCSSRWMRCGSSTAYSSLAEF